MKPLDVLLILVAVLFATGLIVDKKWAPQRREHEKSIKIQREHLQMVADRLADYHERTGRYPTMEEGLETVEGLREATYSREFKQLAGALADLPYVRSPHGVPYLYENRRAVADRAERAVFLNAPSRADRKVERYSQRIDDGVFITSLGLMHDVQRVFGEAWFDALLWFGGGLIVTLTAAYVLMRNRNRSAERYHGINATIILGVAIVLSLVFVVTGGHNKLGANRRPKFEAAGTRADLAKEYLEILKEWSDGGAYDPVAYQKVATQIRKEFALPPEDAPRPN